MNSTNTTATIKPLLSLGLIAFFSFLIALQSCSKNDSGPGATQINVTIVPLSTTSFTLTFDNPVAGLETSNISIDNNITIKSVTHTSDTEYSIVTNQPINYNTKYNITLTKTGFTFDNIPLEIVTTVITATVSALSTTSFTLTFNPAVADLKSSNIILDNGATVNGDPTTTDSGLTYTVTTTSLTPKAVYTVTINLAGYTFNSPLAFTGKEISTDATLKSFSLKTDTSTFEIKNPAEGTTAINNAPRLIQTSVATLTAMVQLAGGATISPDPATVRDYTTAKTFTVTAEDGTTTKTYTFSVPAYHKDTNPYGVYTPKDLSDVRNALDESYKMMNDITLPTLDAAGATATGITDYAMNGWFPIGTTYLGNITDVIFTGTFDGAGNIVSGLELTRTNTYAGLFGNVGATGVIKNTGVEIRGTLVGGSGTSTNGVGALIGYNIGNVSNCYVTGGGISGNVNTGGLVGANEGGDVSNCYSAVNVSAVSGGGLIGVNVGAVSNCYWNTEISGKTEGIKYAGAGNTATNVVGKTTSEMQTATPYDDTWTSDNWIFVAGQYPKLKKK